MKNLTDTQILSLIAQRAAVDYVSIRPINPTAAHGFQSTLRAILYLASPQSKRRIIASIRARFQARRRAILVGKLSSNRHGD